MPYTCSECVHYNLEKQICKETGRYYPPDDSAQYCSRFIPDRSKTTNTGCFLSSACVEYKGLPDDCHELQTLRSFRDNVLSTSESGKSLIKEYYAIAPAIVRKIEASDSKASIYGFIYNLIKKVVAYIELPDFDKATVEYIYMVKEVDKMLTSQ